MNLLLQIVLISTVMADSQGVTFQFKAPDAQQVFLAGTFNNWNPQSIPMKKKGDGIWEVTIKLPPGTYYYKFVINGNTWREDPDNPAKVDDGYGGFNSAFTLTEDNKIKMEAPGAKVIPDYPIVDSLKPVGKPIYLAIVWHQHQPRYFKDSTGEYLKPWVRLHCIKDYYDMASILQGYPDIHLTINLTPVLLNQIEDMINIWESGKWPDTYMRLTMKPAEQLSPDEKAFIVQNFFSANWDNKIKIWPRYRELLDKRVYNPDGSVNVERTLANYTVQDIRDLQVWFNLAWFDPDFQDSVVVLVTGDTIDITGLIKKGRNFTEDDKKIIADAELKIMKAVEPIHRYLQDKGQIEVITTPYFHPILPLIYDTDLMSIAMPNAPRPKKRFHHPEDALWHVEAAAAKYDSIFGRKPVGMWPAEGSVAKQIVNIVRKGGFQWMASDAQVLGHSLGTFLGARELYRPYWAIGLADSDSIMMVFRDTDLSDAIGFRYQKMPGVQAANDFIMKLYDIHKKFASDSEPVLVTVILDGENAWEWYRNDGKEFFHSLYSQLSRAKFVKTVQVREYLEAHPPTHRIDNLWAGSWIGADFSTWIGEPEENKAWDYLADVRSNLAEFAKHPEKYDPDSLRKAFWFMYAAEGSDWFWWLGSDQSSGYDAVWASMFNRTLKQVYLVLGEKPPAFLDRPIVTAPGAEAGSGGVMAMGKKPSDLLKDARLVLKFKDREGDDYGPGTYVYPTDASFKPHRGHLDLLKFEVYEKPMEWVFVAYFKELTNPWGAPLGFSHQLIYFFISDADTGSTKLPHKGLNVTFDEKHPWDVGLKIAGWPEYGELLFLPDGREVKGFVNVTADPERKAVIFTLPKAIINTNPKKWIMYVLVASQDGYGEDNIRAVKSLPEQWAFGGAKPPIEFAPRVIDMLDPSYNGKTQEQMLSDYGNDRYAKVYGVKK